MANLLKITPEKTIEFHVLLSTTSTCRLQLENTSDEFVAFKIKTTAPKNYLVRPSNGTIPRGGSIDVQIILQPMQSEPPAQCNDRFLVQATAVKSDGPLPRDYWTKLDKAQVQDHRLNVSLKRGPDQAAGAAGNEATAHGAGQEELPAGFPGVGGASQLGESESSDFKSKYEELVQYCMKLGKEKKELENKLEHAVKEGQKARGGSSDVVVKGGGGFEIWHMAVVALVAFLLAKFLAALNLI